MNRITQTVFALSWPSTPSVWSVKGSVVNKAACINVHIGPDLALTQYPVIACGEHGRAMKGAGQCRDTAAGRPDKQRARPLTKLAAETRSAGHSIHFVPCCLGTAPCSLCLMLTVSRDEVSRAACFDRGGHGADGH